MKLLILFFISSSIFFCKGQDEDDYADMSEESNVEDLTSKIEVKNCTKMRFYCESCNSLVMCVDSDYGFMKQHVQCPTDTTCLRNLCTSEQNPLCDGTANLQFKCHVSGMFPDPFDCRFYHFCIPITHKIVNNTMQFLHYKRSCPEEDGIEYGYDPKSTYCTKKLDRGCTKWPVPICTFEGETGALEENKSIFYVCDLIKGHFYPHLYACAHGEEYNNQTTKCEPIETEKCSHIFTANDQPISNHIFTDHPIDYSSEFTENYRTQQPVYHDFVPRIGYIPRRG